MAASSISLDPDLLERVQRAAQREVRSPEFLLRDAIELYFRVHGETQLPADAVPALQPGCEAFDRSAMSRAQFLQEAEDSMADYRKTGLHLTHREVSDWIERLKQDPDAGLPACHT